MSALLLVLLLGQPAAAPTKPATPEKQAEHLQRIERHVTLADGVITALSSFAKLPVPNMQPFPIARCVQEALETNPVAENIVVTMAFNVPLNNKLAATGAKSAEGASVWQTYLSNWTAWNHVRTIAALAACASFLLALSE